MKLVAHFDTKADISSWNLMVVVHIQDIKMNGSNLF